MQQQFQPDRHIRNVSYGPKVKLLDSRSQVLQGILGVVGTVERLHDQTSIGADRIIMEPGSKFELHTHPGAHILYVMSSRGFIHIDGVDYEMAEGDTVYVPADYAHGVKAEIDPDRPLEILSFGVPHMPLESAERMTLVES